MARSQHLPLPAPVALFLAFALAAALLVVAAQPAEASRSTQLEQELTQLLNQARSSNGLAPLTVKSDLTTVAVNWSSHMGSTGNLAHNPNYSSQICCWQRVAENVGMASVSSVDDPKRLAKRLHDGFMASSGHRANILSPHFTEVGVGGVITDNGAFVTQNFRTPQSSSTSESSSSGSSTTPTETKESSSSGSSAPKSDSTNGSNADSSGNQSSAPATPAPEPEPEPEPEPKYTEEELAEMEDERDAWLYVTDPKTAGLWVHEIDGDYAPSQATLLHVARTTTSPDRLDITALDRSTVARMADDGEFVFSLSAGDDRAGPGVVPGLVGVLLIGAAMLWWRPARN